MCDRLRAAPRARAPRRRRVVRAAREKGQPAPGSSRSAPPARRSARPPQASARWPTSRSPFRNPCSLPSTRSKCAPSCAISAPSPRRRPCSATSSCPRATMRRAPSSSNSRKSNSRRLVEGSRVSALFRAASPRRRTRRTRLAPGRISDLRRSRVAWSPRGGARRSRAAHGAPAARLARTHHNFRPHLRGGRRFPRDDACAARGSTRRKRRWGPPEAE